MNVMGLDLNAVGNHEFDEGAAEQLRMRRGGTPGGRRPGRRSLRQGRVGGGQPRIPTNGLLPNQRPIGLPA